MNSITRKKQQYLKFALKDFILKCCGDYNLFQSEINALCLKYPSNEHQQLQLIRANLNRFNMSNGTYTIDMFINSGMIENIINIDLLDDLISYVDFYS